MSKTTVWVALDLVSDETPAFYGVFASLDGAKAAAEASPNIAELWPGAPTAWRPAPLGSGGQELWVGGASCPYFGVYPRVVGP